MAQELLQVKLTQDIAKRIVARFCEYDTEIPLKRRLCLLSDEFNISEHRIACVLALLVGPKYATEPYKEYIYW